VTSASIGAVELTGNWLSSASDTCRTVEAAGSVLASVITTVTSHTAFTDVKRDNGRQRR
jgi:hypothetical protein